MVEQFLLPEPDPELREKLERLSQKYRAHPLADVIERRDLTDDLMTLKVAPRVPIPLFPPGRYCTLWLAGATPKQYSIVSAPHEGFIELFVELLPQRFWQPTSLTPRIWGLDVGDAVTIFGSNEGIAVKGDLTLQQDYRRHVMVATVTGIAPFVSMLRAHFAGYYGDRIQEPIYVFQGASYRNEFVYDNELERMAETGRVVYEKTVSQVPGRERERGRNLGWQGNIGRVNNIFLDLAQRHGIGPENTIVYLCGNEGMILDLANRKPEAHRFPPEDPRSRLGKLVPLGYATKEEKFY